MNEADKKSNYFIEYVGGYKTALFLGVIGGLVGTFVWLSHGMTEKFAHDIATLIVTLDGIILGFTFVGVTLLLSERAHFSYRMVNIFNKHFDDFIKGLKVVDVQDQKKVKKDLTSCIESAIEESSVMPSTIPMSTLVLATSILLAFTLFGVNETMTHQSVADSFFCIMFALSLFFLLNGVFFVYKFISELVSLSIRLETSNALKESLDDFIRNLETIVTKRNGSTQNPEN